MLRRIRRTVEPPRELHTDEPTSKEHIVDSTSSGRHGTLIASRRGLLAMLGGGAVASAAGLLAAAGAVAAESDAPRRDPADAGALNQALFSERSAVARYRSYVASAALSDDERAVLLWFHDHHQAYCDALKAYLGPDAARDPGAFLPDSSAGFAAAAADLVGTEASLVRLHSDAIGSLKGTEAAALMASIVLVEARHEAALDELRGAVA